jgi:CubicO group peptidase (beta-lactamase class C family)
LGRTPQERWTSFSVAKSVTAMLVGAAIADGKIASLNDKVSTYLTEMKGSAYDDVSVRQLITMTSGVKWNEDYQDPNSDVARVGLQTDEPGINPVIAYMRKLPRAHPPGSKFVYNTGETDLTGLLVSTAVGKPLSTYMSEKIWQPYGMEQDAVWMTDQGGHERGGCCLSMSLRDYARFGQFMLEDGVAQGKAMVPNRWVELATSYQNDFGKARGYGFFMWIIPGGYAAEGIFGQQIFVFPQDKLVIAVNSAWASADKEQDWIAQEEMARAVRASLTK